MQRNIAILSRVVAAVLGGYGFATVMSIWLARTLPVRPASALVTALLASFLLFAIAAIWAFAARTATRAWVGLVLPTVLFGAWAWAIGGPAVSAP